MTSVISWLFGGGNSLIFCFLYNVYKLLANCLLPQDLVAAVDGSISVPFTLTSTLDFWNSLSPGSWHDGQFLCTSTFSKSSYFFVRSISVMVLMKWRHSVKFRVRTSFPISGIYWENDRVFLWSESDETRVNLAEPFRSNTEEAPRGTYAVFELRYNVGEALHCALGEIPMAPEITVAANLEGGENVVWRKGALCVLPLCAPESSECSRARSKLARRCRAATLWGETRSLADLGFVPHCFFVTIKGLSSMRR